MREELQEWITSHGFPGWVVPDYTVTLLLAIAVGSSLTLLVWKKERPDDTRAVTLVFWGVPCLLIGARLFSWIQFGFPSSLSEGFSRSGFSLYGGLIGLLVAWTFHYFIRSYPVLDFLDCTAPGLALGLFVGRIGCFLAGCDGGIPSTLPWAVRFPSGTSSYQYQLESGLVDRNAELSLSSHPTQLYESLFGLAAFLVVLTLLRNRHKKGEVFLFGMLYYGVFRLLTEPLRAPTGGWHPFSWLTFAQSLSILLILASVLGLLHIRNETALRDTS